MAHLWKRGSIYWIKYYDDLSGEQKAFSTKIRATREGRLKAQKLMKEFENSSNFEKKFIEYEKGIEFHKAVEDYITERDLKSKTAYNSNRARDLLIEAAGLKNLKDYSYNDFKKLMKLYQEKKFSITSKGIYNAHLYAIFEHYKKRGVIKENIITRTKRESKPVQVISDSDLELILNYFKAKNKKQYFFLKFLLITGFRKSTAVELKWEDIKWDQEIIRAQNIKRTRDFIFPLTKEIIELLKEEGVRLSGKILGYNYEGIKFFRKGQLKMIEDAKKRNEEKGKKIALGITVNEPLEKVLSRTYTLHQFRKTFITKLLENNLPLHIVKELADHTDIRTTLTYYTAINKKQIKEDLNKLDIFKGIEKRDEKTNLAM